MNPFTEQIAELVATEVGVPPNDVGALLAPPPDPELGEYAFPCFEAARHLRRAPSLIAQDLAHKLEPTGALRAFEAAGPYLNVRVDRARMTEYVLRRIGREGMSYGNSGDHAGQTFVIDFSSPNIARRMGIAHLRSTAIGRSIAALGEAVGYRVVRINHLGDWGTQFGKLIVAFRRWGDEAALASDPMGHLFDLYVRFHREAEADPALDDEGRATFRALEAGDPDTRALWERFRSLSIESFGRIYAMTGVEFDSFEGEAAYAERANRLVDDLLERGIAIESRGAVVVPLGQHGLTDCLLRKADEGTVYAARDLAAVVDRRERYGFDRMVYVVGTDQALHFQQVFKILELMGFDWADRCEHASFGLIHFAEGRMSTRRGAVIFLEDVFGEATARTRAIMAERNPELGNPEAVAQQVGIGAVIFADLGQRRSKDVEFRWDSVLNFQGGTGPYIQYTHARMASILRKGGAAPDADGVEWSHLVGDAPFGVVRELLRFPDVVWGAAQRLEPTLVARYAVELATVVNVYYTVDRVLVGECDVRAARLLLVGAARTALARCLSLLGMAAPEAM
jgi:arginyl-tRNA synthetase